MAQMFRFERNGVVKVAELIEQNDKAKTVTLKMEDGTFKATSLSTFKRWWKPVAEEVQTQDVVDNVPVQVTEEPKKEAKKKAPKKSEKKEKAPKEKKAKKEVLPPIDVEPLKVTAVEICNKLGFEEKLYPNLPNIVVFKLDGKGKAEVRFSRKGFVINVKPDVLTDGTEYRTINNYYLPAALDFTYDVYAKELERVLKATAKWYGAAKKAASDIKEKKSKKKEKEES